MIKEQYKNYTPTKCALCKEEKELMKTVKNRNESRATKKDTRFL